MRSRILNPEFFRDETLAELPFECRLAFAGLWCAADKNGRFVWSIRRLKADLFAYDDDIDLENILTSLESAGFVTAYDITTHGKCGYIPNFLKYQKPHKRESDSTIPKQEGQPKADLRSTEGSPTPPISVSVSTSISNSVCVYEKSKRLALTKKIQDLLASELNIKCVMRIWDWSPLSKLEINDDWVISLYRAVFDSEAPPWVKKDPDWLLGPNAPRNIVQHYQTYLQKINWRSGKAQETDLQVAERLIREQN